MSTNINSIPIPPTCPNITDQDIRQSQPIYEGSYCNVYQIKKNGKRYAVKVIYKDRLQDFYEQEMKRIYMEIKTIYSINHESIIQLCGHYNRQKTIGLIFPMFGEQIGKYIYQLKQKKKKMNDGSGILTIKQFIKIFRGIGSGICELHARGLVHRDISQDNILIDQNLNIKIIDFGFVSKIQDCKSQLGTTQFIAPQVIIKNSYNHKADVWSFGILCYQLIYGLYLFKPKGKNLEQEQIQRQYIINMQEPIPEPPLNKMLLDQQPNEELISYIKLMLSFNPDKRPEVGCLLSKKIFGAEQRQGLTYNMQEYIRQKTFRKTRKTQGNNHLNPNQLSIRELQQTLSNLTQLKSQQLKKKMSLFQNLISQQTKLCKAQIKFYKGEDKRI